MHMLSPLTSTGSGCIFWTRPNESKWLSCHFGISVRAAWCFGCLPTVFQDMVTAAGICLRCMTYGSEETCGHAARARACPILLSTWAHLGTKNWDMGHVISKTYIILHPMNSNYILILVPCFPIMSQFNPIQHISIYFHIIIAIALACYQQDQMTFPISAGHNRRHREAPCGPTRISPPPWGNCWRHWPTAPAWNPSRTAAERFAAGRFRTDFDITIPKRLKPIKSDATDCDEVVFSICLGVTKGPTICWYYCSVLVVLFIASTVPPAGRLSIGPSPKCRSDLPRHGTVVRSGTWRAGARLPSLRGLVPLMLSGYISFISGWGRAPNLWHFFWSGTGYNREFGGPNFEITSHNPPWG